jgi:Rha family phage regulatory protein
MSDIAQVQERVRFDGEQLVTDSRMLAKTFNKRHGNVLRAYDGLPCSAEFSRLNFEPTQYVDEQGKTCRAVKMTKEGFTKMLGRFQSAQFCADRIC